MTWRINRYIIREILPYFGLVLLIVTGIIFAHEVSRFSELFVKRNVPPALVQTLLAALLIRILIITLPISLLVGTLLGLSRLAGDNEITILLGSGLSKKQLLIPLLSLTLPITLLMGYLTLVEGPRSASRFRQIRGQLIVQGIRTQVKPHIFDTRFANQVLYISGINRRSDLWAGIFLASSESGNTVLMTGQQGTLEVGPNPESSELHLFDGVIHRIEQSADGHEVYHLEGFSSHHVRFNPRSRRAEKFELEAQQKPEPVQEKSIRELLSVGREKKNQYLKARVEAGRRLALPIACLLFAPLGLLFGLLRQSPGRSAGFIISLLLATVYYMLLFAGEKLARAGILPPLPAMWLGNVTFASLAFIGVRERRSPFRWSGGLFGATRTWGHWWLGRIKLPQAWGRLARARGIRYRIPGVRLTDQYLLKGFARFFLLSLSGLWLIFMVFTLFELAPDIIAHGIGATDVFRYFFYLSPEILQTLTPPCVLIASLMAMGVLMKANEVTVLKACGISSLRITFALLAGCLVLLAAESFWQEWVVPTANQRQDRLRFYIKKGRFPSPIELSPLLMEGNWVYGQGGRIFHFAYFNRKTDEFNQLQVLDINESDMTIRRRIEAKRAVWDPGAALWELEAARIWVFDGDQLVQNETVDRYSLYLEETPDYFKKFVKKPGYMSRFELADHIRELKRKGVDVSELEIALKRKVAFPFACLIMGLVGIPFGFFLGRKGALFGAGIGVALGLVYWLCIGFFGVLGKYGYVGPDLAGWGPDGVFGGLGTYVLFRVRS